MLNKRIEKLIQEPFISNYTTVVSSKNKDVVKLQLNKKFGKGFIIMYEIFPNVFIFYNNYRELNPTSNYMETKYKENALIVSHCLSGNSKLKLKDNTSIDFKKNVSIYFSGRCLLETVNKDINELEHISLFCYCTSLYELGRHFSLEEVVIKDYLNQLCNMGKILVGKTDPHTSRLLIEFEAFRKEENFPMLKIKGIELFIDTIINYQKYKKIAQINYNPDIINKVERIKYFLESNWTQNYTIVELSKKFNISQTYIKTLFKYLYGMGPSSYIKNYRLEKAKEMLKSPNVSIIDVSFSIGYSNPSQFSHDFKCKFGILPSKYKNRV